MEIMAKQYSEGFHKTSGLGGKQCRLSFCGIGELFIQCFSNIILEFPNLRDVAREV